MLFANKSVMVNSRIKLSGYEKEDSTDNERERFDLKNSLFDEFVNQPLIQEGICTAMCKVIPNDLAFLVQVHGRENAL